MAKKFVLILWTNTKGISTVISRDVRKGETKWDGKWYQCEILKESGKYRYQ